MKLAVKAPEETMIVDGKVTVVLLLDSATLVPPAGAAVVRVTVQVDVPGALTVAGEQLRDVGWTGAVKLTMAD